MIWGEEPQWSKMIDDGYFVTIWRISPNLSGYLIFLEPQVSGSCAGNSPPQSRRWDWMFFRARCQQTFLWLCLPARPKQLSAVPRSHTPLVPALLTVKRRSNIYSPTPRGHGKEKCIYTVIWKCKRGVTGLLLSIKQPVHFGGAVYK